MHPPAEQASSEVEPEIAFSASVEAALHQSESQYCQFIEPAESAIFICDVQGNYISVNPKICQMLGYTGEELLQLTVTDVTAPTARGNIPDDFGLVLAGKSICVETLLQRQDGTILPVELSAKMLENGQVQGIVRDISSRQRTLEASLASEARFQKLAANMPGAIYQFLLRPDGSKKIVYISSGCRDLYELDPEAVQQNADLLWSLTHPDDLQSLNESVILSALNLTPWHHEGRIITRSGKLKWIQGSSRPEKLETGDIVWDGLLFDITARKMAEIALKESEEKYRDLIEGLNEAVYRMSVPSGEYEYFSPAAKTVFGYAHTEFLDNHLLIQKIIHPNYISYFQEKWAALCQGKVESNYEYKIIDSAGKERWILQSNKGIFNNFGYLIAVEGICRDITKSKLAEEELRRYQEKLEDLVAERTAQLQETNEHLLKEIVERQQVEVALRVSEARFRAAAEGSLDAFFIFKTQPSAGSIIDFTLTYLNSNAEKMISMSQEEVIGKRLGELLPDREDGVFEKYVRVIETGIAQEEEFYTEFPGGRFGWLKHQVVPLPDGVAIFSRDITERKSALEALRQSEARFQNLAANMPGMIYQYVRQKDGSQYFSYISPGCREIYERDPEEIQQNSAYVFDVIHPEDREEFERAIDLNHQNLQPWSYEGRIITPSGNLKWIQVQSKPEKQANGDIICDGLAIDVTDRKRTGEALERSYSLLHSVMETLPDCVFVKDLQGRYVMLNSTTSRFFGKPIEQIIGKTDVELRTSPEVARQSMEKDRTIIRTKKAETFEELVIHDDGRSQTFLTTKIPWQDGDGNIIGLIGIARDISDRKEAEEALKQREALYRAIVEDQTELICRFKPDGTRTFVNDAYCRYFGETRSELIGKNFVPLLPDEDRELINQQFASLSPNNPAVTYEHRVIMPNGEIRWQQWTNRAVFDEANNFIEFQAVGRDISERKVAEAALQRSYQRLMLLKQITAEIRASLDTKQILQTAVTQVGRAFAVSRCLIHVCIASPVFQIPFVAEYVVPGCESILDLEVPVDDNPHMQQVLAQDKAIASDNVYTDPLLAPAASICRQFGLKSMLAIRTSYQGQPNGVLGLHQCDGYRHWTEEEIELFEAVATQVGIALFQAQLLEQQTEQGEKLAAQNLALQRSEARFREQAGKEAILNQIASQIHSSLDIDAIIKTTLQEIRQLLQIDRAGLMWYRPDLNPPGWEVIREAKAESVSSGVGLWASDAIGQMEQILYRGEVLQIDDAATLEEPILSNSLRQWGYASLLNVPFRTQTGELGALSLAHCSCERPWKDSEVELMQAVAVQLAIAIDQAELYKQTHNAAAIAQAQAQRQELLNRLVSQIRASLDLDTILETAVSEVYELLQPDRCIFVWYRLEGSSPYAEVVHEVKKSKLRSLLGTRKEITDSDKVAQRIFNKEIFLIDDSQTVTDEQTIEFLDAVEYRALLALPIHTQSGEIGLISCSQARKRRNWSDTEVELLKCVADQLAIAIDQAELYTRATTSAQIATEQATKLEAALQALQKTQTQLIQSEKMSSLGQMVAGIAHEINNPISFIYGNVDPACRYIDDLLNLIALIQQNYPILTPEIQEFIEEIDLDFTIQDLPKVMSSMKMGATRIRDIVRSLRSFSRLDEADLKPVFLHEGIDNTLLILEHRLKANASRPAIELIKEYGELPPVECYAGQLNQVFMNLLCNAIDALEDRIKQERKLSNSNFTPSIRIHTEVAAGDWVISRIADNGMGIPEDILTKIFDPFFTTKPVGSGTGMGLAISYQIIVEKHQGRLSCHSQPGKGTEFIVEIPLRRQQLASNNDLQVDKLPSLKE